MGHDGVLKRITNNGQQAVGFAVCCPLLLPTNLKATGRMLTLILIFIGARKMRKEMKKSLLCIVFAVMAMVAVFAQSGTGSVDQDIAKYTEAIRLNPNDALAYFNRGVTYNAKEDYDHAIADYSQVIRINPNLAAAYNNRGASYRSKGEHDRAIADCNQALRINPNLAEAYCNRGLAYNAKEERDRAIIDYTQAIRINPNYTEVYHYRGNAYYLQKDYTHAREDWEKALQLDDPNSTSAVLARFFLEALRGMGY
jgi:tetratricopeptide (TPR) repeat protein